MVHVPTVFRIETELLIVDSLPGVVNEINAVTFRNSRNAAGEYPCFGIFGRNCNLTTETVDVAALIIL